MTFAAGASASIMKTIYEMEDILKGENLSDDGPKREALRAKLQAALIKSSRSWYKKGFNRGHKECYRAYKKNKCFPSTLKVNVEREFIPNSPSTVALKSTLTETFMSTARKR